MKHLFTLVFALLASAVLAVEVSVTAYDATCFQCNGAIQAFASGGLPPYAFLWTPAPPTGQGTSMVSGLCPGEYNVEVTDGLGNTAQSTVTINSLGGLGVNMNTQEVQYACDGGCTGWAYLDQNSIQGTPPYSYDFPFPQFGMFGTSSVAFAGLCPGETIITVTDANGCAGTIRTYIGTSPAGSPTVANTSPACGSLPSGSVTMPGEFGADIAYWVQSATFDSIYNFGSSTGPYVLGDIPPGTHTVYYWWNQGGINGVPGVAYCTTGTEFTIGSLAGPCGGISGRAYHDANEDCSFNGADFGQPYRVLSIEPGGQFTITDSDGLYQRNLNLGTYTVQQPAIPDEAALCPASGSASFTLDNAAPQATIDFANLSTVPHDLSATLTSTNARPGFGTQVWLTVMNNSAFPSGQLTIALSYDPILLNPSNASWSLPGMAPYGSINFTFTANVPADIGLLGANLNYGATVTNTVNEPNTANNTTFLDVTITGSYDPNDKRGNTSSRASEAYYFLNGDDHIDYTVRFQNTGTAAAETVVIRDVIDTDLDITSLRILGASHDFVPSFGEGRELAFTFNDINLPDSTTDPLGSQGFISYRIEPTNSIVVGDVLENTAGIYFDFNPPIITNTTSHVVEFSTALSDIAEHSQPIVLSPNPATDRILITGADSKIDVIEILATDGRLIHTLVDSGISFNVTDLVSGCYIVHIKTKNGRSSFARFTRS